jgi:hypothetical protein
MVGTLVKGFDAIVRQVSKEFLKIVRKTVKGAIVMERVPLT